MQKKTSEGRDGLDMCLVKKIIPYVVTPLKHIFNTSLQKGIFPDSMKKARVIPLFKSGMLKIFQIIGLYLYYRNFQQQNRKVPT